MAQVDVGATATVIVAQNRRRTGLIILNYDNVTLFIDKTSNVTVGNGYPIEPGDKFTISYDGDNYQFFPRNAIYGIIDTTTSDKDGDGDIDVRYIEFEDI